MQTKKPPRQLMDQVKLKWFGRHEFEDETWVSRVLAAITEHLPALTPARFSDDDGPPWERFGTDGPQWALFQQMCRTKWAGWHASEVGYEGQITGLASAQTGWVSPARFNTVRLDMDARLAEAALADGGLKPIVASMAVAVGAVYVYGYWERNVVIRAGETWHGPETDHSLTTVMSGRDWQGLPWDHVWLEWFGEDYVPLVEDALAGLAVPLAGGLLAEYGWDPRERFRPMPRRLITQAKDGGRADVVPPGW